jgi:hypothetical protein
LPYIDLFFDDKIFSSTGYTARECLKTITCNILADYIHNVRKNLSYTDIFKSINYFSKYLLDASLPVNIHHACCRILLSLLDVIKAKQQVQAQQPSETPLEPNAIQTPAQLREIIVKVLEVVVTKLKMIAKYQVTYLVDNAKSINEIKNENVEQLDEKKNESDDEFLVNQKSDKKRLERLELFLNSFEDKDASKVCF